MRSQPATQPVWISRETTTSGYQKPTTQSAQQMVRVAHSLKHNLQRFRALGLCAWAPACCCIPSRARNDCCARWRRLCCALPGRPLLLVQLSLLLVIVQHRPCMLDALLPPPLLLVAVFLRALPAEVLFPLLPSMLLVSFTAPLSSSSAHHELDNLAGVLVLC